MVAEGWGGTEAEEGEVSGGGERNGSHWDLVPCRESEVEELLIRMACGERFECGSLDFEWTVEVGIGICGFVCW